MNVFGAPGRLTSGRRTYRGNRLVGGVPNSQHLDGSAGDYVGTSIAALQHYFPGAKVIPESDHLHVQGLPAGTFPYFGNQGIAGLVNGVDTTAPKGLPPVAMKPKARTLADIAAPNMGAMMVGLGASPAAAAPMTLADLSLPQGDIPQKKHSKFNAGNILGVLGDALMAYGGLAPQFGPNLERQREIEQQQGFDREKLNAMLDLQREKALAPKPLTQTQKFVNEVMDPNTPPARKALLRAILTRPLIGTITNPDGSQYQTQTYPGDSSDDDWEYSN